MHAPVRRALCLTTIRQLDEGLGAADKFPAARPDRQWRSQGGISVEGSGFCRVVQLAGRL
jgi:hypothetical protein